MQIDPIVNYIAGPNWTPNAAMIDPSDVVAIIVIPSLCLMIGWLAWMLTRTNHLKARARIALQKQLLENLNSAQEVVELMRTEEGRAILESLTIEQPTSREQILGQVQKGVILMTAGLGALSLRLFIPAGFGLFIVIGVFVGAVGLGFLISSAVAYKISKSWGLLRNETGGRADAGLFR